METRKIIIVDSAANQKVVVDTDATNFGELKKAARAAGINYEGKDWLEGITKTSPMADDSLLPTHVNYKGTITNNLIYMLTNTNKKIRSGMDRKALYAEVKRLGISEEIKKKYGKNYTQVGNDDLAKVVAKYANKPASGTTSKPSSKKVAVPSVGAIRKEMIDNGVNFKEKYEKAITVIAKFIAFLPKDILEDASEAAKNLPLETVVEEVSFSDADLKELFRK